MIDTNRKSTRGFNPHAFYGYKERTINELYCKEIVNTVYDTKRLDQLILTSFGDPSLLELYIKVDENNNIAPDGHPQFKSNLRQLYPWHIFWFGPPKGWMKFVRINPPILGPYQKWDDSIENDKSIAFETQCGLEYKIVDGVYMDVWHVLDMTEEEKQEKILKEKSTKPKYNPSWIFDEKRCCWIHPIPHPDFKATWDEKNVKWTKSL